MVIRKRYTFIDPQIPRRSGIKDGAGIRHVIVFFGQIIRLYAIVVMSIGTGI